MKIAKHIRKMLVKPGTKISLSKHPTNYNIKEIDKKEAAKLIQNGIDSMITLQDKLYSHNEHSILIVIQAMDAAGKDSIVKHVLGGLNPTGVKVTPFKTPTEQELEHDYLWRHNLAIPARGEIGIFIRSHYENVLVTRVHPEYILNERIPGINELKDIDKSFFRKRFRQINDWERHLSENGMTIIKIFLHSSKEDQKKQFLERIEDPSKNWKFSMGDLKERKLWDEYMAAYEDMLSHTSTEYAPWYIVPADDRWFARVSVSSIIQLEFEKLNLDYPQPSNDLKTALLSAKDELLNERN